ncbi:MAG TPA: c-type cytochrome [Opitutaceae bacterium]|nr:c-type cytochrome [Opitutaceae bacterium]
MKFLKYLGYGLGTVLALLALLFSAAFVVSNAKLNRKYAVVVTAPAVPRDAASIARGAHIAQTRGCVDCHGQDLGGATVFNNGAMGRVDGPNLTRGTGGLGASLTDADYVRAIRHGVAPDGRGLFLMPSADYAAFTSEDMADLIAYLKSVPPVNRRNGPVALGPVARVLLAVGQIRLAAEIIDHSHVAPATVTPGPTAEYGRYLAAGCTGCHGDNFSGGKIKAGPPDWPPAANLTPGAPGGITTWTEADFVRALRTFKRPDGSAINAVMPRDFAHFDDVEIEALYRFLKTLPAAATGSHN